jgi:hypothetical protein
VPRARQGFDQYLRPRSSKARTAGKQVGRSAISAGRILGRRPAAESFDGQYLSQIRPLRVAEAAAAHTVSVGELMKSAPRPGADRTAGRPSRPRSPVFHPRVRTARSLSGVPAPVPPAVRASTRLVGCRSGRRRHQGEVHSIHWCHHDHAGSRDQRGPLPLPVRADCADSGVRSLSRARCRAGSSEGSDPGARVPPPALRRPAAAVPSHPDGYPGVSVMPTDGVAAARLRRLAREPRTARVAPAGVQGHNAVRTGGGGDVGVDA